MSSRDFGLGPKWWQKPANKLKKCSERKSDWCDPTETDGCCAVIPCTYCLELEIYGQGIQYGTADFTTMGWEGTVGGGTFFGFWEVGYESGECEFVVHWNGEEVYRKGCADGQSCRDSSDEAEVVIDYEDATLSWIKHEYRPLPYVKDSETDCTVNFCDDCECSCECLCVTIERALGGGLFETLYGEICDVAYTCDPPIWEGTVGPFLIPLALDRDEYGRCIIVPTIDGVEQDAVLFSGCSEAGATITLPDTSTIAVRCKKCDCAQGIGNCICARPLGKTLTMLFASANAPGTIHEIDLTYGQITEPGIDCDPFSPGSFPGYSGSFSGTLAMPMGGSRSETIEFILVCECTNCDLCLYYRFGSQLTSDWCVTTLVATDCTCPALLTVGDFNDPNCDLWSYQISDITIIEKEENC